MVNQLNFPFFGSKLPYKCKGAYCRGAKVWCGANPKAYAWICAKCCWYVSHRQRFSIRMLTDAYRVENDIPINDHHTPYIIRFVIDEYPAVAEWVELRPVRH